MCITKLRVNNISILCFKEICHKTMYGINFVDFNLVTLYMFVKSINRSARKPLVPSELLIGFKRLCVLLKAVSFVYKEEVSNCKEKSSNMKGT